MVDVVKYLAVCLIFLICNSVVGQEHFHIWFERSGGFTGMTTKVEVDSDTLSSEEVENVCGLIEAADYFNIQNSDNSASGLPDQFQYKITIEYKRNKRTLELGESDISEKLRPLVNYLTRKARLGRSG